MTMGKAYSDDFRTCVFENYDQGKTTSDILSIFHIGSSTLKRWVSEYRTTGSCFPKKRNTYRAKKFSDLAWMNDVKEHPLATLEDIAQHLSVKPQSVWSRLNLLGITRKKNIFVSRTWRTTKTTIRGHVRRICSSTSCVHRWKRIRRKYCERIWARAERRTNPRWKKRKKTRKNQSDRRLAPEAHHRAMPRWISYGRRVLEFVAWTIFAAETSETDRHDYGSCVIS